MRTKLIGLLITASAWACWMCSESPSSAGPTIPSTGATSPDNYPGMTLVWRDEFSGSQLNTADWNYETGGSGWGNNELEYYQPQNTSVQSGYLIIEARKENVGGMNYTSSRLTTKGKQAFRYGRIDIRAVLPKGQGLWPALWMLGASIDSVGWPACGEVDIMELIGGPSRDSTVYGTAHWDDNGHASEGGHTSLRGGKIFADDFHVFSIVWNASSITWLVDNTPYVILNTTPAAMSELQKKFFLVFNVAVGGNWPGNPDATTVFPQHMVVDYVRVFQ
jgi:beta-glucanase (GH16 family)